MSDPLPVSWFLTMRDSRGKFHRKNVDLMLDHDKLHATGMSVQDLVQARLLQAYLELYGRLI